MSEEAMSQVLTFSGKPINKMNYAELRREKRIQRWFARRADRMCWAIKWGNEQRRKELAESTKVEDAEAAFERGECTADHVEQMRRGRKRSQTNLKFAEDCLEFLQMHVYQAKAIGDACQDMMQYRKPPKRTRKKPYKPYVRGSYRWTAYRPRPHMRPPSLKNDSNFRTIEKRYEKAPIGPLWNKEKFLLICADRGYGSQISAEYAVAQLFGFTQRHVKLLLNKGNFTWSQVLMLGAEFEMTPKEFTDTFLSGYFKEITDDEFRASADNIPDVIYPGVAE